MKWLMLFLTFFGLSYAQQNAAPAAPQPAAPGQPAPPPPMQIYPESAQQLKEFAEVAQAIASAGTEIMLATDVLRSQEIAEAIRALVVGGVPVYIIAPEGSLEDPNSYLVSLGLAGANIRVGPVQGSFVVIDRQTVVDGILVSGVKGLPKQEETNRTILVPDEAYTASYVDSFYQSYEVAPVLDPATLDIFQPTQEGASQ
jgi:hypothetical protein